MIASQVVLLFAFAGFGSCIDREARWFNRGEQTITKTVKATQWVTKATPSSCVVVQTSLPPCRNIRAVNIQPTQPVRIMQTEAPGGVPMNQEQAWKPIIHPSNPVPAYGANNVKATTPVPRATTPAPKPSSWGWNLFNFGPRQVYVTQTLIEVQTSQYLDPNTVVTFSVKGCRPSRLPFDLPECEPVRAEPPTPAVKSPESGIVVMAPVHFFQPAPLRTPEPAPKEEIKETVRLDEKEKNKEEKKPAEENEKKKE